MRVRRLTVEDFRSYARVAVALDAGITAFVGENGAGKTNLLEAIHLVARGESDRARDDSDMIRWGAQVSHVVIEVERAEDEHRVECVLFAPAVGERRHPRRWLLDGVARRADAAVGIAMVVAFFPEDVALLGEAPGARRRYVDAMVGQVERRHRADSREYQRVLEQRNALLRSLRESGATTSERQRSDELAFWSGALCTLAGAIADRRAKAVTEMGEAFRAAASTLGGGEELRVSYVGQCEGESAEERTAGYRRLVIEKGEREVWQGTTLVGPHREDLAVTAEGRALPTFASRGQHRSAVLALKLAEADWIRERTGDTPVFLLDDVLSELDPRRRDALVTALPDDAQVLVTAALPAGLPPALRARAAIREVTAGVVA